MPFLPWVIALLLLGATIIISAATIAFTPQVIRAWARIRYRSVVVERHGKNLIMTDWNLSLGMPLEEYIRMLAVAKENPEQVPGMIALWRVAAAILGGFALILLILFLLR